MGYEREYGHHDHHDHHGYHDDHHHHQRRLERKTRQIFEQTVVLSGQVKIHIDQRYPLAEVQQAHRDLEARKTTGSTILTL